MATTPPPTALFFVLICSAAAIAGAQRDAPPPPPVTDPYARFNPSIAIIIVILLSALFLMGFFALYIRRCADDDPSTVRAGGLRSRRPAAPRGLDPAVVAAFPTLEYSVVKDLKLGKSALECAVCLCEFDDDEALRLLPACSHVFHPDCIGEWLRSHTTCPVCRANLAAPGQTPPPPDPIASADSGSDPDSVAIDIHADPFPAAADVPARPPRAQRAKSMRRARFPRSHSTGHSVVRPGEDCERYTLRLPEEVRKEVLRGKLNRTWSSVGGRGRSFGRWERFARSDRWVPFFSQSFSGRPSSRSIRRCREELGGSGGCDGGSVGRSGRMLLTSVKAPFECLTGARAGADPGESSSRSAVPVITVTSSG